MKLLLACSVGCLALGSAGPALAGEPAAAASGTSIRTAGIPTQLDAAQRQGYQTVFAAIRDSRWTDAQIALDSMAPGPLHAVARAELYTAKGSPRVEMEPLVTLVTQAPELPQAEQLARLARTRGATELPALPPAQRLVWNDGAPNRIRAKAVKSDLVAADLALKMQPFVKADQGAPAEALLDETEGLTPEARTEWQQRVSWIYYIAGDDGAAQRMSAKAAAGTGEWAVQGHWLGALAAWRQNDCKGAAAGFEAVSTHAADIDLRAAASYWAARADMACARPDRIEARLKTAAQYPESFYGQLARQALGMADATGKAAGPGAPAVVSSDWQVLGQRPNIRVAAALAEIDEDELADKVVRQQARIGDTREFPLLVRFAASLDLPATSLWLAHNCPKGVQPVMAARYPAPRWAPASGWRVDKSLVYAHTLQESGFRHRVVSPAGAYGLMQIMPAAATDFARERGLPPVAREELSNPAVNMDVGQRHLERLRDMGVTGGLLPKVIAAYNAGPTHVGEWNSIVRDGGDPLLYIESLPYWETRGYVTTVLRNYWMYEGQAGKAASPSRAALAQGMWPRFPGLQGPGAVRMNAQANRTATASAAPVIAAAAPGMAPTRAD